MKCFMIGLGIGLTAGMVMAKFCPAVNDAMNKMEKTIKQKIDECSCKCKSQPDIQPQDQMSQDNG